MTQASPFRISRFGCGVPRIRSGVSVVLVQEDTNLLYLPTHAETPFSLEESLSDNKDVAHSKDARLAYQKSGCRTIRQKVRGETMYAGLPLLRWSSPFGDEKMLRKYSQIKALWRIVKMHVCNTKTWVAVWYDKRLGERIRLSGSSFAALVFSLSRCGMLRKYFQTRAFSERNGTDTDFFKCIRFNLD